MNVKLSLDQVRDLVQILMGYELTCEGNANMSARKADVGTTSRWIEREKKAKELRSNLTAQIVELDK